MLSLRIFLYPLDFAIVKMDSDLNIKPLYSGVWDCWNKVSSKGGFLELFSGLSASILALTLYRQSFYQVSDIGKYLFFDDYKT